MDEQDNVLDEFTPKEGEFEPKEVTDPFNEGSTPEKEVKEPEEEEDAREASNRRQKRMAERIARYRQENIELGQRLQSLSERPSSNETEARDYLKQIEKIYGTQSPEAKEATDILKSALAELRKDAAQDALKQFREIQAEEARQAREEESRLSDMIERLEDNHNFAFTDEQEKGFFRLMEKMSPKDTNGEVIEYADPEAVFEIYQSQLQSKKTPSKAKEYASKSLKQGGTSNTKLSESAELKYLNEIGVL